MGQDGMMALGGSGGGGGAEWVQLRPKPRGSLNSLVPELVDLEAASGALLPGQALVAVQAVGINFRDVLNVGHGLSTTWSFSIILLSSMAAGCLFSSPSRILTALLHLHCTVDHMRMDMSHGLICFCFLRYP
jgi:hypothetical protein